MTGPASGDPNQGERLLREEQEQEVGQAAAKAECAFRVQGPPKLDYASSWSNYKRRLAICKSMCKACNMSEQTMGAMIAMSLLDECKFKANLATRFYDRVEQRKMETDQVYNTVLNFL